MTIERKRSEDRNTLSDDNQDDYLVNGLNDCLETTF